MTPHYVKSNVACIDLLYSTVTFTHAKGLTKSPGLGYKTVFRPNSLHTNTAMNVDRLAGVFQLKPSLGHLKKEPDLCVAQYTF